MSGTATTAGEHLLVCTDLDRTLIPNGKAPESPGARERFARLVALPDVMLAYVTGRHRELVIEAIDEFALPLPDFVIGDVGTSIHAIGPDGAWTTLESWEAAIAPDWNGLAREDLERLLADIGVLELQEPERQKRFKLSYYVALDADGAMVPSGLTAAIAERLAPHGVNARVILSTDEIRHVGLVDVLPARASKLHALEYLMRTLGFDAAATVYAGDSGNDLEVLASPIPAVLVANAADDVRSAAAAQAAASGTTANLYLARGGLLGMNGNYSAGILEGIVHYHPAIVDWIELKEPAAN